MKRQLQIILLTCALLILPVVASNGLAKDLDLRQAVPKRAFLAVHGRHNPERDYQRAYFAEVWETVKETEIIEKIAQIVTSRMDEDDVAKAEGIIEELREAVAPIDCQALLDAEEVVYAQIMDFPQSHHLVLVRLTPEAASSLKEAVTNLFHLIENASDGHVGVEIKEVRQAEIVRLVVPAEVPVGPTLIQDNDIVLFATTEKLARRSHRLLTGPGGKSKFDDPRLKAALKRLPQPEDALTFYDGKKQMKQLGKLPQMIREQAGDNEEAERWVELLEEILGELAIIDHTVVVEYTEQNRNCRHELGQLAADAEGKLLTKMLGSGQLFENWETWVPADASSYRLNTGVNLLPLYQWAMEEIEEHIPEAEEGLAKFRELQEQFDVDLEDDILSAFSGESVSVVFPAEQPSPFVSQDSVLAMRCSKPDRIRELLHRLISVLQQAEQLKPQEIALQDCDELDGFEQLSVLVLNSFGLKPVIGFSDGWMMIGSSEAAVRTVLATRSGDAENITASEDFQKFHLDIEGPVAAIGYTDLAASTRQLAMTLNQIGAFVPTILAMAGAQADEEDLEPVQEALALLPKVAQIVEKFDFLEEQVSVTQPADEPYTYHRRGVILVRPPADDEDDDDDADDDDDDDEDDDDEDDDDEDDEDEDDEDDDDEV